MRALCAGSGYKPGLLGSQNLPCVRPVWAGQSPRFSVPDRRQRISALWKQKEVNTNQFQCKCQAAPALKPAALNVKESPAPGRVALAGGGDRAGLHLPLLG